MKKLFALILCFVTLLAFPLSASAEETPEYQNSVIVKDNADILTRSQENKLKEKVVTADFSFTVTILTVSGLDGMTAEEYANNYYDSFSSMPNGILFLISIEKRDWYILTVGEMHERLSDSDCNSTAEEVMEYLSADQYYEAFDEWLDILPKYLNRSYTFTMFFVALAIGAVVALITLLIMRSCMNTVKPQHSATGYLVDGSYDLKVQRDFFLYSRITKTAKPKNTGSSGGGSRGGSGGKF